MRRALLAAAFVAVGGSLSPGFGGQRDAVRPDRVLVVPFENIKGEGAIFWLSEASAILLTDNLTAAGLDAFTRSERQQAFERLQVPASAVVTDATLMRIGQLVGAAQIVIGALHSEGEELVVRARRIELEAGRVDADITERGAFADLFAIFDRIARRLAPPVPSSPSPSSPAERPPVAAFENFVKGLLAETPTIAVNYLNAALKRFPQYDRARMALWEAYAEQGDYTRALASLEGVDARSQWARRARFYRGLSQLSFKRYDEAFAAFKALADEEPTPTVLNNLGIVQLRRGGNLNSGLPTAYFDRAAQADPGDPDYFFNLGYAHWEMRDTQAAVSALREAVRRNPADGDAHFVLGAALAALGNAAESAREKELARRLSSTYEEWQKRPAAEQVPRGLERVKNNEIELPHARRVETKLSQTSQRDQQELAAFYLDRARRLARQESDREALAELDRALYLSPYLAEAHLLMGRIHLRNGRAAEAIDSLKISLWSAETAEAHTVLAEAYLRVQDPELARVEAERALALDPESAEARRLVDMLKSP